MKGLLSSAEGGLCSFRYNKRAACCCPGWGEGKRSAYMADSPSPLAHPGWEEGKGQGCWIIATWWGEEEVRRNCTQSHYLKYRRIKNQVLKWPKSTQTQTQAGRAERARPKSGNCKWVAHLPQEERRTHPLFRCPRDMWFNTWVRSDSGRKLLSKTKTKNLSQSPAHPTSALMKICWPGRREVTTGALQKHTYRNQDFKSAWLKKVDELS